MKTQTEHLKCMALNAGACSEGQDSGLYFPPDESLARFVRAIAEDCATQWDGCVYEGVGENIDIGQAIRNLYRGQS